MGWMSSRWTRGCSYIINITRGSRSRHAQYFENETFTALSGRKPSKQVEVKRIDDPDNEQRQLVLCRSAQRREKEQAILSKAEEHFLADGKALRKRIEAGRLKKSDVIERNIGALFKKHPRVARFYKAEHKNQTLYLHRNDEKLDASLSLCGDYVLKTDKTLEAETLWELYMTLLEAERGFRLLKGTLGLRPNFHRLEQRVDGHIFITWPTTSTAGSATALKPPATRANSAPCAACCVPTSSAPHVYRSPMDVKSQSANPARPTPNNNVSTPYLESTGNKPVALVKPN